MQGTKTGGILYIQAVNDGKVPPSAVLKSVEFEMKNPKGRIKLLWNRNPEKWRALFTGFFMI